MSSSRIHTTHLSTASKSQVIETLVAVPQERMRSACRADSAPPASRRHLCTPLGLIPRDSAMPAHRDAWLSALGEDLLLELGATPLTHLLLGFNHGVLRQGVSGFHRGRLNRFLQRWDDCAINPPHGVDGAYNPI